MEKEWVGIIGGGIIGLMSAYSLRNNYVVYVFEPDYPIKGASEGNAGTMCPNLKPWSTKNPFKVLKSNIFDKP